MRLVSPRRGAAVPASPVIARIDWPPPGTIVRKAKGGDNWPLTGGFPTKWMSDEGKTVYLVFSGDDHFSVRKAAVVTRPAMK